jgi:hypothetical protein
VRYYEVGGKRYIQIVDYLTHAHDKWTNVGRPEYPVPDDWAPPSDLIQFLIDNKDARNVTPERFGVSKSNWPSGIEYPFSTYSIGDSGVLNRQDVDVDVDETTADKDSDKDKGNDSAPPPAGAAKKKCDTQPTKESVTHIDTPQQSAANACLAIFGLSPVDLSKEQAATFYKSMIALIGQRPGGAPEVEAWAQQQHRRSLGTGAKPEKAIPGLVRQGVTAAGWGDTWASVRNGGNGNGGGQGALAAPVAPAVANDRAAKRAAAWTLYLETLAEEKRLMYEDPSNYEPREACTQRARQMERDWNFQQPEE